MKKVLIALILLSAGSAYAQKFEGLALTPPMGWNSWNTFGVNINERLVMDMADAMVSSGMKSAGYTYLVLDDAWLAKERDADGNLIVDPARFPHGIKYIANYVHAQGLKFGLYNCAGTKTCAGYPGTHGYEEKDARQYAAWEVDYLKYDWCNTQGLDAKEAYTAMSKAIKAAGRPMIFSLCEWGSNKPWEWAAPIGQMWRTTTDITNSFSISKKQGNWEPFTVLRIIDAQNDIRKYAGPDHWNDPDMLEVGHGMTASEDRAHFSMWCMLAAPLIAGNDLRNMTRQTISILTNKEVIAVDQDALGVEGYRYSQKDSVDKYPETFGNAGIFSPAFWIAPQIYTLTEAQPVNKKAGFYLTCGDKESADMVRDANKMDSLLHAKGASLKQAPPVKINAGAVHNELQWRQAFPAFYNWLMERL